MGAICLLIMLSLRHPPATSPLATSPLAPRTWHLASKVSQECVISRGVTGTNNEGSSSSEDEKERVDREAISVAAVLQRQCGG
jgi:hypothetical protein